MNHPIRIIMLLQLVVISSIGQSAEPLHLARTIPLSHVEGRIDHLAADAEGRRLFIAALGNNTVEVVDLASGTASESIRRLDEPQGIAFLKDSAMVAVA